ncbi:hypothetical protein MBLNU459_g6249t1 [Dothideomycetes sp. NU459]
MVTNVSTIVFGIANAVLLLLVSLYHLSHELRRKEDASAVVPGCRRLGLVNQSNLSDEYSPSYSGEGKHQLEKCCKVKALVIYPIKSCGHVELGDSDVTLTGLRYDRQFCFAQLVSEKAEKDREDLSVSTEWVHRWKFITQRRHPRLVRISTEVWIPDPLSPGYSANLDYVQTKGCIVCKFGFTPEARYDMEGLRNAVTIFKAKLCQRSWSAEPTISFKLPIAPDASRSKSYPRETMQVWKDFPEAINISSEIQPDVLSKLKYFLGVSNPLAIFQADPLKHRPIFRNAPTKEEAGFQPGVGFADAYPLHILNIASVQKLASMIPRAPLPKLSALRFRANIYITGPAPYTEDDWKEIRIADTRYHVSCRTTRCELPNVDPDTGIADRQEPLRTLKKERGNVDVGASPHPCLGMQMVPLLKDAGEAERIRVGDEIEVVKVGEHRYVRMFQ